MSERRWGRWVLLENCILVFRPEEGEADPAYELNVKELQRHEHALEWVRHVSEKRWARTEDIHHLARACNDLLTERLQALKSKFAEEWEIYAPPPMDSRLYEAHVNKEWRQFLDSADPTNEAEFQSFLEKYACLLPNAYTMFRGGHNGVHLGGVITQPELPGFRAKRPDFLILVHDSETILPILIEIEAPAKRWCNDDGTPTAKLNQAIDQLREWKTWFSDPANVIAFQKLYHITDLMLRIRQLSPKYVLIYGRRSDAHRIESFAKKRVAMQQPDECFMTYDRLSAGFGVPTIQLDRSGPDTKLKLISLPPTFILSRRVARMFCRLANREQAINACELMTPERRAFLMERIAPCDEYVRRLDSYSDDSDQPDDYP
jgi:hypothetical protein